MIWDFYTLSSSKDCNYLCVTRQIYSLSDFLTRYNSVELIEFAFSDG